MNALQILFTAIANAIRAKKSTQGTIKAEDFPTEISSITTGKLTNEEYAEANDDVDDILENTIIPSDTITIAENGEYDVASYAKANVNVTSTACVIQDGMKLSLSTALPANLDTSNVTDMSRMFESCSVMTTIPQIDTSNVTNMSGMFQSFRALRTVPLLDTSNVTNMSSMFSGASYITTLPLFNTSKVTDMRYMCRDCASLTEVPQFDTSNVTNMGLAFSRNVALTTVPLLNLTKVTSLVSCFDRCNALTNDSLYNIMESLANGTNVQASNKRLSIIGLSLEQATICTSFSNWSAVQAAGWSTGYSSLDN